MQHPTLPIPIADPRLPTAPESPPADRPSRTRLRRFNTSFRVDGSGTDRVAVREHSYRRALGATDIVSAFVAAFVSLTVLGDDRLRWEALALVPLVVLTSKLLGLYDRDELLIRKTTAEEVPALFQLATIFALMLWLTESQFVDGALSRVQVLGLWFIMLLTMVIGRWAVRGILSRVLTSERYLVIGSRDETQRLSDTLTDNPINATIVGRLELVHLKLDASGRPIDRPSVLRDTLETLQVDRVVVAPSDSEPELTLEVIRTVKTFGARVSVLPHVLEVVGSAVAYDDVFGIPVLGVRRFGLTRSSQVLKRTIDIVSAGLLLLLLSPVLLLVALLVKRDSPGPVLFRQDRMGRMDERFRMLKFRSMVDGAEALKPQLRVANETEGLFKIADDPRITRIGRHLRKTSLDELPQLINVLRGDMSMVGPRPLIPDEDAMIKGAYRRRLALTPGITGPWQILGSARVPLSEMVQIDYLYAANWSSWGDVKILVRTVIYVLRRGGL